MTVFPNDPKADTKKRPDISELEREFSAIRTFAAEMTTESERRAAEMRELNIRMQRALSESRKAVP